jgi:ABC-2 type transport system ATP-binding protein
MSKDILTIKNLTKKYDENIAVKGISFSVKKGEIFGILGPNGAGKTTTLEMIETLREIDGGEAWVDGLDVSKDHQKVKYIIGVQPQAPAFMDKVKLTEQLEQLASAYGQTIDAKALLKEVDLEGKASSYCCFTGTQAKDILYG